MEKEMERPKPILIIKSAFGQSSNAQNIVDYLKSIGINDEYYVIIVNDESIDDLKFEFELLHTYGDDSITNKELLDRLDTIKKDIVSISTNEDQANNSGDTAT